MHHGRAGAGSAFFLLSVSTFQSQPDCFPLAGWAAWLARPVGLPRFSSFHFPGYEEAGAGSLRPPRVYGVGAGKEPVLLQGWGRPPHQSPPGKCNKALTFL